MDLSKYRHTESVEVDAAPEIVFDLLADVTRMGEWSNECTGGTWVDDDRQWFTGTNRRGSREWETRCHVDAARRGEELTFTNWGLDAQAELVRWSYTMVSEERGCRLTESWEVLAAYETDMGPLFGGPAALEAYLDGITPATHAGMATTLARVKAAAEAQ